jgi:protein-ribulosamine 3-kinase
VYRGHREADLAMAELFGGFDARFHAAYREAWPLLPGYAESRRPVYQLYYLLVHVNLFGGAYVEQTAATLRRAAQATSTARPVSSICPGTSLHFTHPRRGMPPRPHPST